MKGLRLTKPIRDIVSSKQTTGTRGRRVLNQQSRGCLPLLHIVHRGEGRSWGQNIDLPLRIYPCHPTQPTSPNIDDERVCGIAVVFYAVGAIK